jgi:hypothetical protein
VYTLSDAAPDSVGNHQGAPSQNRGAGGSALAVELIVHRRCQAGTAADSARPGAFPPIRMLGGPGRAGELMAFVGGLTRSDHYQKRGTV